MAYLYGDSSPSPLVGNFLEFLRDALDFSVIALHTSGRLEAERERAEARRQAADVELRRLEALEGLVQRALASAAVGSADSPTARCAVSIEKSAGDLVANEREAVCTKLAHEIEKIDAEATQQRDGCFRAFETLVRRHDLPQSALTLNLKLAAGARYVAKMLVTTPYGLGATVDLEVPPAHAFAHVLRLDRIAERLEVQAPELSGLFQKKVRLRAQRLEKYYLTDLVARVGETAFKLRGNPTGDGDGFDLIVSGPPVKVRLERVGEQGESVGDPMELSDADPDTAKILEVRDKLAALSAELLAHRKAVVEAHFDGQSLRDLDHPARVVERLVSAMAPTVHEIAKHSLTPSELVIKRLLSDDRREECFVSKKELRAKIDQVPDGMRALFDPLGLADPESVPKVLPAAAPAADTLPRASAAKPEISEPAIPIDEKSMELVVESEAPTKREDSVELTISPEPEPDSRPRPSVAPAPLRPSMPPALPRKV